ncbi:MAG: class I SAM-dependent methyltransferase [Desulfovibrio sp.]
MKVSEERFLDIIEAPRERLELDVELESESGEIGQKWLIERTGDLETLWEQMGEDEFGEDERIPYWGEIWPASILLGRWLLRRKADIQGKLCLDIGCGLGLTGIIGSSVGARVVAFDYEWPAVYFASENTRLNNVPPVLWACMDWREPAFGNQQFDFMWAGDVFYEKRFFEPLEKLLRNHLTPDGVVWIGEPVRTVSRDVWAELAELGWKTELLTTEYVSCGGQRPEVNLRQLSRR